MTRLLTTTTALVALAAMPAFADSETNANMTGSAVVEHQQTAQLGDYDMQYGDLTIHAEDLSGAPVYIPGEGTVGDEIAAEVNGLPDEWERIGEIGGVVVSREGDIKSVTLDAGGFLGIGEKEISTSMDELKFVSDGENADDWFIVFTGDRRALEDRKPYDQALTDAAGDWYMTAENWATQDRATTEETHATAELEGEYDATLAAEEIDGAPVYDAKGDEIGNISEILLSDGKISDVIIDVGGFLGIGEKPVAVSYNELVIDKSADTTFGDVTVSLKSTRAELEKMPAWDGQ